MHPCRLLVSRLPVNGIAFHPVAQTKILARSPTSHFLTFPPSPPSKSSESLTCGRSLQVILSLTRLRHLQPAPPPSCRPPSALARTRAEAPRGSPTQPLCTCIQVTSVSPSPVPSPSLSSLAYPLDCSKLSSFLPQGFCAYWSRCLECPSLFPFKNY